MSKRRFLAFLHQSELWRCGLLWSLLSSQVSSVSLWSSSPQLSSSSIACFCVLFIAATFLLPLLDLLIQIWLPSLRILLILPHPLLTVSFYRYFYATTQKDLYFTVKKENDLKSHLSLQFDSYTFLYLSSHSYLYYISTTILRSFFIMHSSTERFVSLSIFAFIYNFIIKK